MKITVNEEVEEAITKTVKPTGNGACIYVPKQWVGRNVKVLLIKEE